MLSFPLTATRTWGHLPPVQQLAAWAPSASTVPQSPPLSQNLILQHHKTTQEQLKSKSAGHLVQIENPLAKLHASQADRLGCLASLHACFKSGAEACTLVGAPYPGGQAWHLYTCRSCAPCAAHAFCCPGPHSKIQVNHVLHIALCWSSPSGSGGLRGALFIPSPPLKTGAAWCCLSLQVDLVLAGHHHTYQRTCPLAWGRCQEGPMPADQQQRAPIYVIIGHGGAYGVHVQQAPFYVIIGHEGAYGVHVLIWWPACAPPQSVEQRRHQFMIYVIIGHKCAPAQARPPALLSTSTQLFPHLYAVIQEVLKLVGLHWHKQSSPWQCYGQPIGDVQGSAKNVCLLYQDTRTVLFTDAPNALKRMHHNYVQGCAMQACLLSLRVAWLEGEL
eukprot:1152460-Pelagomonas_calceolata.AAC.2